MILPYPQIQQTKKQLSTNIDLFSSSRGNPDNRAKTDRRDLLGNFGSMFAAVWFLASFLCFNINVYWFFFVPLALYTSCFCRTTSKKRKVENRRIKINVDWNKEWQSDKECTAMCENSPQKKMEKKRWKKKTTNLRT